MKKLLIFLLCSVFVFSSFSAFAVFDDVDEDTAKWAGEAIDSLTVSKVINGYPDGTFKPNGNVTRAEFAKMLTVAFELLESDAYYKDTQGSWAASYIRAAVSCMYTEGELFRPDDEASRADIAYAVASALKLEPSDASATDKFDDADDVMSEMKSNIAAAVENEIIVGYEDNTLRPNDSVTRAEAAVIIYRALNIKNAPESETPEVPNPPAEEVKPDDGKEHINTLYPCRDVLLVTGIAKTASEIDGDEAYRISYRISGSEGEYSSLVASDTVVLGTKTSVSQLKSGDVMVMDTAFMGQIGCLYVFASFDEAVPVFNTTLSAFKDYTVAIGKVTDIQRSSKGFILTLYNGSDTTTEYITKSIEVNVYAPWKKAEKWSLDSLSLIDPAVEDAYVFIRYTDGVATEIVVSDIQAN